MKQKTNNPEVFLNLKKTFDDLLLKFESVAESKDYNTEDIDVKNDYSYYYDMQSDMKDGETTYLKHGNISDIKYWIEDLEENIKYLKKDITSIENTPMIDLDEDRFDDCRIDMLLR